MRVEPPLLVREAIAADAESIGELHAEAWRAGHRDVFECFWLRQLADRRRAQWAEPGAWRGTVLVAVRGDRVAAFVHFGRHSDTVTDGEVFDCYAHPSVWGRGVARTLMDAAVERAGDVGFRRLRLWTMAGTNRARYFYESFGFQPTGRRREHDFGDGRPVLEVEYAYWVRAART